MTNADLLDGCDHVETRGEFEHRLKQNRPLTVKFGIDPTGSELHLGHAVILQKLRQFSEAGHRVVLLIGDFTALIGDPTGRNEQRPHLSREQIQTNMQTYREQAGRVLDLERSEVMYNSTWLSKLQLKDLVELFSQTTVAQMLERNDFRTRYSAGIPISLHEFLYPIAQAYDSIALRADVEFGGSEQLFNLLLGREYQTRAGQPPQVCLTLPILEGIDGRQRMSKSLGNYISIGEPAESQFGKLMSIPDEMIPRYARLAAFRSQDECDRLAASLRAGSAHPMNEKKHVAMQVVSLYHGVDAARAARDYFERTVQRKEAPADEMPELSVVSGVHLADILVKAGFAGSKRAGERLISGKGVRIDGAPIDDPRATWTYKTAAVLSVGSRKFVRIVQTNSRHSMDQDD
ncbi:MAG: tyrosine--tRNA ligase [Candidatus Eremiobacteraeota bacterium]|nr:tyrosine--tRNA ligase [Candidatus Eremiobacteraeota bacterium]